jgi:hypothetical protein
VLVKDMKGGMFSVPSVAFVGWANAGKSSMTEARLSKVIFLNLAQYPL